MDGDTEGAKYSCCYCALKTVFQEFEFSDADTLPPDCLRSALSSVYDAQGRFKIGDMEDATETIETILGILHACNVSQGPSGLSHLSPFQSQADFVEQASDFGCHPMCLGHEVFGIEYIDVTRCTFCGATGEPSVSGAYLYRAYVTELIDCQYRAPADKQVATDPLSLFQDMVLQLTSKLAGQHPATLQEVLRRLCQRDADGKCSECNSRKTLVTERWLTKQPKTFILSLIWPTSTPGREALWLVLAMIQPQLRMDQIFQTHLQTDQPSAASAKPAQEELYGFHGMICYFGMHYVALFWCPARKRWIFFDDTSVREKADWNAVAKVMMSGQYLPTLLFYERVSEEAALADSLDELTRQVNELEQQPSCAVM